MEQDRVEKLYNDKVHRIDKYFNEKQDSIARSVAINNASQIVSALINSGKISELEEIKNNISELSQFIYNELTR